MPRNNTSKSKNLSLSIAAARILVGFVFLWAFLDKLFGLGYSTPAAKSWLNGASPTFGFLNNAAGPFGSWFHALAGLAVVDWLFMLGLLGIGVALIFGIAIRLAVFMGSLLLLMMWAASLPIKANPIIDEHIIYIAILAVIVRDLPSQKLSLTKWWQKQNLVKKHTWLI
jgi:thiosulfate dehydrogenase [quinone] large subunit